MMKTSGYSNFDSTWRTLQDPQPKLRPRLLPAGTTSRTHGFACRQCDRHRGLGKMHRMQNEEGLGKVGEHMQVARRYVA